MSFEWLLSLSPGNTSEFVSDTYRGNLLVLLEENLPIRWSLYAGSPWC